MNINGEEYISDVCADKIIPKLNHVDWVLSMRFGKEDWKDESGYYCVLNIIDRDRGCIIAGRKLHCVSIDGYDYINRKELEKTLADYFLKYVNSIDK